MIKYNLKHDEYKNHPMDGKYGVIVANNLYANYPLTIVDNHTEVVNGRYTKDPALCLLHLAEDVRQYMHLRVFDEFLYLGFSFKPPTYRMFPYKKEELTKEQIIKTLKRVFYQHQPSLQRKSLVGSRSNRLEDDPNYYEGHYVLNDEEEYTILKCRTTYRFYKGVKSYYPHWKSDEETPIFEGEIDFELYSAALELERTRVEIVTKTNQILDEDNTDSIASYKASKHKLDKMILERI